MPEVVKVEFDRAGENGEMLRLTITRESPEMLGKSSILIRDKATAQAVLEGLALEIKEW